MKAIIYTLALVALLISPLIMAQDYAEYARGAGMRRRGNNRAPLVAGAVGGIFGAMIGGWTTSRRLKKKHEKEKKELVQYIQLQEEIYKTREQQWQTEYQKVYKAYDELEKETLERDYEEFKAPDTNNDDMISRAEFNTYVRKYLSSFPELSEKDFPKFEEFDLDGDGIVSFEEWQKFLYQQKLMEAQKGKNTASAGGKKDAQQELLSALYQQASQADSFNSLQKQMGAGQKGRGVGARRA